MSSLAYPAHVAFKSQYRHTLEICLGIGVALHLAVIYMTPPIAITPYALAPLIEPIPLVPEIAEEIKIGPIPPEVSVSSLSAVLSKFQVPDLEPLVLPDVGLETSPFPIGQTLPPGHRSGRFFANETEPKLLKRVPPVYPALAREAGAEGTVQVLVTIGITGRVIKAMVVESDTVQSLRAAALEAARGYLFAPARQQGRPVRASVYLTFEFRLH